MAGRREKLSIMSKKRRNRQLRYRQIQHQEETTKEKKAEAFGFIQKINFILAKIRETNTGMMETEPSDNPNKKSIQKVTFPEEGGVLVHFEGEKHPKKGFPYSETVETVDEVKKTGMAFLRGFFGGMKYGKVRMVLFALLFRKQFMAISIDLLAELDYRMYRVRQKPERYCTCAREIYRVFNKMIIWYPKWEKILGQVRNIICMILEYDDAYRYPFQDVMPELNKDAVRKDVGKEIKRILDFEMKWDHRGVAEKGTAKKFEKIGKLLFLLKFSKKIKVAIMRFFLELDLDKIKLDEDDRYHARYKWHYDWDHLGDKYVPEK